MDKTQFYFAEKSIANTVWLYYNSGRRTKERGRNEHEKKR